MKVGVIMNLDYLNDRQREAVLYGNGPLLILAGAGSGKTEAVLERVSEYAAKRKRNRYFQTAICRETRLFLGGGVS